MGSLLSNAYPGNQQHKLRLMPCRPWERRTPTARLCENRGAVGIERNKHSLVIAYFSFLDSEMCPCFMDLRTEPAPEVTPRREESGMVVQVFAPGQGLISSIRPWSLTEWREGLGRAGFLPGMPLCWRWSRRRAEAAELCSSGDSTGDGLLLLYPEHWWCSRRTLPGGNGERSVIWKNIHMWSSVCWLCLQRLWMRICFSLKGRDTLAS